jgi:electron transfer flavoprotein alpha subunit
MAGQTILVIGEAHDGMLRPVTLEGITAATKLAGSLGLDIVAGISGSGIGNVANELASSGVSKVLAVEGEAFGSFTTEAATAAAAAMVEASSAAIVFIPGTTSGRDYAPRLAARLGAVSAADVTEVEVANSAAVVTRPVYGGKMAATMTLDLNKLSVVTYRPGSFEKAPAGGTAAPIDLLAVELPEAASRVTVKGLVQEESAGTVKLESATTIVSGGRGLKEPDNFAMVEQLASALNAVVGASRAVVDAGWRQHHEQVGQTGRTVSPRLYVAVGISGAVQHLVGMQGSEHIVAINRDPDAPIFKIASFGIVGDLFDVVPAIIDELNATA